MSSGNQSKTVNQRNDDNEPIVVSSSSDIDDNTIDRGQVKSKQSELPSPVPIPARSSKANANSLSVSVSECSDSDFEARITTRKRGSKLKKPVERSKRALILHRYQLATAAAKEAGNAEKTSISDRKKKEKVRAPINSTRAQPTEEKKRNIASDDNVIIRSYYNVAIKQCDLSSLEPGQFIRDSVIAFYFEYLENEIFAQHNEMFFVSPTMVQQLKLTRNFSETLPHIKIHSKKFIFLPLNDSETEGDMGSHWYLVVLSRPDKRCYVFDSSFKPDFVSKQYSVYQRFDDIFDMESSIYENVNCLRQQNTFDCALHVIANAHNVAEHIQNTNSCQSLPSLDPSELASKRNEIRSLILRNKSSNVAPNPPIVVSSSSDIDDNTIDRGQVKSKQSELPSPVPIPARSSKNAKGRKRRVVPQSNSDSEPLSNTLGGRKYQRRETGKVKVPHATNQLGQVKSKQSELPSPVPIPARSSKNAKGRKRRVVPQSNSDSEPLSNTLGGRKYQRRETGKVKVPHATNQLGQVKSKQSELPSPVPIPARSSKNAKGRKRRVVPQSNSDSEPLSNTLGGRKYQRRETGKVKVPHATNQLGQVKSKQSELPSPVPIPARSSKNAKGRKRRVVPQSNSDSEPLSNTLGGRKYQRRETGKVKVPHATNQLGQVKSKQSELPSPVPIPARSSKNAKGRKRRVVPQSNSDSEPLRKGRKPARKLSSSSENSSSSDKRTPQTASTSDTVKRKQRYGQRQANQAKPAKKLGATNNDKDESFTSVKMKLNQLLKEEYKDKMEEIISELSINAARVSSLASLLLLAKANHFLDRAQSNHLQGIVDHDDKFFFEQNPFNIVKSCFYEVCQKVETRGRPRTNTLHQYVWPMFDRLLEEYQIDKPYNDKYGNMFKYIFGGYFTNFRVNIQLHAESRLKKFFRTVQNDPPISKNDITNTAKFLFRSRSLVAPNEFLLAEIEELYPHPDINYNERGCMAVTRQNNWFRHTPLFLLIQRRIETYNREYEHTTGVKQMKTVRQISIIPICKYRRQHIHIDTDGLFRIFGILGILPRKQNNPNRDVDLAEFSEKADEHWSRLFNDKKIRQIRKRHRKKETFGYRLHSDGVSVTVLYKTQQVPDVDTNVKLKRIRANLVEGRYVNEIGIDVGCNTFIAAVTKNIDSSKETNFTLKSKKFHRRTRNNERKKKFVHFAGEYEAETAADRNDRHEYVHTPSACGTGWLYYIKHSLKYWERGIEIYTTKQYASMAFNKYTNTQKVMDQIANTITQNQPSVVFMGAFELDPSSPIKGHMRCPGSKRLFQSLKKLNNVDIVFTDEFNTSRHCGNCFQAFPVETKSHRFKVCHKCPSTQMPPLTITTQHQTYDKHQHQTVVWQRDVTAARLIWYKGRTSLLGGAPDTRLVRQNQRTIIW